MTTSHLIYGGGCLTAVLFYAAASHPQCRGRRWLLCNAAAIVVLVPALLAMPTPLLWVAPSTMMALIASTTLRGYRAGRSESSLTGR